jgi:IS30 family transposase
VTPEKMKIIESMRSAGKSYRQIGNKIGMSPGAVSYYCLKEAIEAPKLAKCWDSIQGPPVVKRGNHVVRRFTAEEDEQLLAMERAGVRVRQIARALGRKDNSIRGRLMCLVRREERAERMAS